MQHLNSSIISALSTKSQSSPNHLMFLKPLSVVVIRPRVFMDLYDVLFPEADQLADLEAFKPPALGSNASIYCKAPSLPFSTQSVWLQIAGHTWRDSAIEHQALEQERQSCIMEVHSSQQSMYSTALIAYKTQYRRNRKLQSPVPSSWSTASTLTQISSRLTKTSLTISCSVRWFSVSAESKR